MVMHNGNTEGNKYICLHSYNVFFGFVLVFWLPNDATNCVVFLSRPGASNPHYGWEINPHI